MAAQARICGSSFRRMKPLASSSGASVPRPFSPASRPYASKNAVFSVRSASRMLLPLSISCTRGSALRCPLAASTRTAWMRTSRSASLIAFSSCCMAPGDPTAVSASTAARLTWALWPSRRPPSAGTTGGNLSNPATRMVSSSTTSSSFLRASTTCAGCAWANRMAAASSSARTRSLVSFGSQPNTVTRASGRNSLKSSPSSSSVGCTSASSSDCSN